MAAGLRRPKTSAILNRSTRQHDTSYSRQPFTLTEFTSASINNHCLDSGRQHWLHFLTRLTNCHQHNHVSSTHARAHALWCAVEGDSPRHHNITYLARDGSRFCVMTATFDFITCNVCSASAVTWPNHAHVASFLKLSLRHNRHIAIPKFKDRSRELEYALLT